MDRSRLSRLIDSLTVTFIFSKDIEFINVKKHRNISYSMSTAAIFAGAFLLFIAITVVVPGLPPAQLLHDFLNIPQPTLYLWIIPASTLFLGATNGLFYGIIAAAAYALSRELARRKPLPAMPVAHDLPDRPPEPIPLDSRVDKYPPAITVRRQRGIVQQDVEKIEGIGSFYGKMLRNEGIATVDDLLRNGSTKRKRQRLANDVGVSYTTIDKWVCRGDLLRVKGIGRQYSELLETAGVSTVTDLSMRDPRSLWQRLKSVNRKRRIVRRIPPSRTIEIWILRANNLEPLVA